MNFISFIVFCFVSALEGLREVNETPNRTLRRSEKFTGLLDYLENEGKLSVTSLTTTLCDGVSKVMKPEFNPKFHNVFGMQESARYFKRQSSLCFSAVI